MYSLLIVDDEWMIREGLTKTVPWEDWGIQVIGSVSNGYDAIKKMAANPPDILLTDIRMPGIDGLELIEHCRKTFSDMKLVILTGHNEFEYAQKALRLGADDLMLKPTNDEELESIMKRLTKELSQSVVTEAETLHLLANQMIEEPTLAVETKLAEYDLPSYFGCMKAFFPKPLDRNFPEGLFGSYNYILLKEDDERIEWIFYGMKDKRSWIQTVNSLHTLFLNTFGTTFFTVSDLCSSPSEWKDIYIQAADLTTVNSENAGIQWYDDSDYSFDITQAVQYINQHFNHLLNQAEIAEAYYVSTSQFSKQFKKFTGLNFVDYLTEIRIEEGKKLLRHSNLKTYEVAAKTGYVEPRYFSQLFKRKTGLTPKQYRAKWK